MARIAGVDLPRDKRVEIGFAAEILQMTKLKRSVQ